jgi:osmotically-inducible protein OsmY
MFTKQNNHYGLGSKNSERSDKEIGDDVSEALYESPDLDASGISVEVVDGNVFLRGQIDSRSTKSLAEGCIENIKGIKDIFNELTIQQVDSSMDVSFNITNDLERDEQYRAEKRP